jgi:hypothetical protein
MHLISDNKYVFQTLKNNIKEVTHVTLQRKRSRNNTLFFVIWWRAVAQLVEALR